MSSASIAAITTTAFIVTNVTDIAGDTSDGSIGAVIAAVVACRRSCI